MSSTVDDYIRRAEKRIIRRKVVMNIECMSANKPLLYPELKRQTYLSVMRVAVWRMSYILGISAASITAVLGMLLFYWHLKSWGLYGVILMYASGIAAASVAAVLLAAGDTVRAIHASRPDGDGSNELSGPPALAAEKRGHEVTAPCHVR